MSQSPLDAPGSKDGNDVKAYLQAQTEMNRLLKTGSSFSGNERNCFFLNPGGHENVRFANVSAVTGFDFPDDGRGLATTDWDFDGDLDFWIINRTGPRLRFLRNDVQSSNQFLLVRLEGNGTTCNRDAIGARLELQLADDKLVKTLKAGEGYQSQSSKWVHFGLGTGQPIEELRVRWPDGTSQSFTELAANGYYRINQATNSVSQWTPPERELSLKPGSVNPLKVAAASRVVLPAGVPLPRLQYRSFDGGQHFVQQRLNEPLLLNLWASWCAPCIAELEEFEQQKLNVVALSVDGVPAQGPTTAEDAEEFFANSGFTFRGGLASDRLLRLLQAYHDAMIEDNRQMPVPTSMLVDVDGAVAAIYKGAIDPEVLAADVAELTADSAKFRRQAAPFSGKWLIEPPPASPLNFVEQLVQEKMLVEALVYIDDVFVPTHSDLANALVQVAREARVVGRSDLVEQAHLLAQKKLGQRIPSRLLGE